MPGYQGYGLAIADLIRRDGEIRADAERRKGEVWGQTIAGLPQSFSDLMDRRDRRQVMASQEAARVEDARVRGLAEARAGRAEDRADRTEARADEVHGLNVDAATLAAARERYQLAASIFGEVTDQASYDAAVGELGRTGGDASKLPPVYSPGVVRAIQTRALTQAQKLEQAQQAEAARHNQAVEGQGKLTAEWNAANVEADNARQARTAEETGRHNRAMEERPTNVGPQPGWQWVVRDGNETYTNQVQPGDKPQTARVKATEDERKTAGFYGQMADAITVLDELEGALTQQELYQIQTMPQEGLIGLANRGKLSDNAKRYLRAFEQFTEARLRPVSGAAISDAEYARDRRTYAKQFAETPKLNADRKTARTRALDSLKTRAGVALDDGGSKQADPLGIR